MEDCGHGVIDAIFEPCRSIEKGRRFGRTCFELPQQHRRQCTLVAMRVAFVAVVLATACNSPQPDVGVPDARASSCHAQEGPLCSETCGNGVIDDCQAKHSTEVCLDYVWTREVCEGDSKSCTDLGYFAGTAPCKSCSYYSTFECDPCPADAELCAPITSYSFATASSTSAVGTISSGYLDVFNITGAALARTIHVPMNDQAALASVADGWIAVSNNLEVTHVSDAGVVGNPTSITTIGSVNVVVASHVAGRVLVVWADFSVGVQAAVVDAATGSLIAGPFTVFAEADADRPSVTTDGTAFFVGIRGKLAKILPDGTVAATTSIGSDQVYRPQVTCAGTTCWYVAASSYTYTTFTAQRFDSNAATIGAPITIAPGFALESFLADGSDLLALQIPADLSGPRFDLVRIGSAGTVTATKTVAAGGGNKQLLRVGSRVAIVFSSVGKGYVAVTTP
jgi:hypothetical protein